MDFPQPTGNLRCLHARRAARPCPHLVFGWSGLTSASTHSAGTLRCLATLMLVHQRRVARRVCKSHGDVSTHLAAQEHFAHFSRLLEVERKYELKQHLEQSGSSQNQPLRPVTARVLEREDALIRFRLPDDTKSQIPPHFQESVHVAVAWHESGGPLGQQNGGDEGEGQSRHFPEFFIGHIIRGAGHEDSRFLDIKLDSRAWLTCEEGTRVHDIICPFPISTSSSLLSSGGLIYGTAK